MAAASTVNPELRQRAAARADARRRRVVAHLADGRYHSGESIARSLRLSRSAVWKHVSALRSQGIDIEAAPRRGYRLARAIELCDARRIAAALPPDVRDRIRTLQTWLAVDSTNHQLIQREPPPPGHSDVCIAEVQTAGRGRRGRTWIAPFGSGLCLSLAWQFEAIPASFSALSLVVAVAVARLLRDYGAVEVALKWPNDVVWRQRKLGGILIEGRGESGGAATVVIGVGINLRMPVVDRMTLAEHHAVLVSDLGEILGQRMPGRNGLAAGLIGAILPALAEFEREGFEPFMAQWRHFDALAGVQLKLVSAAGTVLGVGRGVAPDGALLVEVAGRVQRHFSGDVTVRAVAR
jgi:BirA family transcriptional regulator, biotin operon repressor / biotin---[acetyl-CoA-carboxylase] ligase